MLKKYLSVFLVLIHLLALLPAAHGASIMITPMEGALEYAFSISDEQFAILEYKTPAESGKTVIYSENGQFAGVIPLPLSLAGGKATVTITRLNQKKFGDAKATLPKSAAHIAPEGDSYAKVSRLTLGETATGFTFSFSAADSDYLILNYRNKQESGTLPVYRADETGLYQGEIKLPLTYARTLTTVKILSGTGVVLAEGQVRKDYEAPQPPEPQEGRLTGVTICVDPGHQENGERVTEPIGPGLEGKTSGTSGSAQGKITLRRESIVCLEVGMALRDELIRQGATVVMTRERQDQFLTNMERCAVADEGGADIMLRLHCDTRENTQKQGLSVYGPRNSTYAKAVADPQTYAHMGDLLLNAMKRRLGYELSDKTGFTTINDQFVGNNWAKMICFLVEMGFMSNPEEDFLLATPVYQQWLAEGMAQGVYEIALYRGLIEE